MFYIGTKGGQQKRVCEPHGHDKSQHVYKQILYNLINFNKRLLIN